MLIFALGIWIIPMTLIFAPCRRLVLLVARLQQIEASIMRTRSSPPAVWRRIARIQTLSITLWRETGSNSWSRYAMAFHQVGSPHYCSSLHSELGEYRPTPLVHEQYSLAAVFVKASMYCPAQLHSLSRFPNQINHLQVDFRVYSAKWSISIDGNPDCNLFIPCNIFLAVSFSCTAYWMCIRLSAYDGSGNW